MKKTRTMEISDTVFANTYSRQPLCLVKGKGATVWDDNGKAYTDFLAGIAVVSLGHCHDGVAKAICEQAQTLIHVSNLYYTQPQTLLARWLVENSFAERVFLCNSGAEANEAAIKLARIYAKKQGHPARFRVICATGSFHGRTLATLSATGQEKVHKGFEPLVDGFDFVPYNDADAAAAAITKNTAAILVEPLQGEGGIVVPDADYLKKLRALCDGAGILLMLDEVQTGMGRTGKLFCHEHFGITPDVMTLAKALGNGLPIGAMLTTEKAGEALAPGTHATTFGGTPLICAGALAVAKAFDEEGVLENCVSVGSYFKKQLTELAGRHSCIEEVRGLGLLLGLKMKKDASSLVDACREKGFLINCVQGHTLRFAPPLTIGVQQVDALIKVLDELLKSF
ncbi:MAG: acetylornithine transaminase [Desulfatibacillaceae bacterium]|nr:acetylornithine transaminase [Desulfatibacillaceae bacterium]